MAKNKKKKVRRNVAKGVAHIQSTFNNTIVTITDTNGDTLCTSSGGAVGFKGSRKSTPFAAQRAAEECAGKAQKFGVKEIEVQGEGPRRRPRIGRDRPSSRRPERQGHRRRDAAAAQRLPPAEEAPRLVNVSVQCFSVQCSAILFTSRLSPANDIERC